MTDVTSSAHRSRFFGLAGAQAGSILWFPQSDPRNGGLDLTNSFRPRGGTAGLFPPGFRTERTKRIGTDIGIVAGPFFPSRDTAGICPMLWGWRRRQPTAQSFDIQRVVL